MCLRTVLSFYTENVSHKCLNPHHIMVSPEPHSLESLRWHLRVSDHQEGLALHHLISKSIPLGTGALNARQECKIKVSSPERLWKGSSFPGRETLPTIPAITEPIYFHPSKIVISPVISCTPGSAGSWTAVLGHRELNGRGIGDGETSVKHWY